MRFTTHECATGGDCKCESCKLVYDGDDLAKAMDAALIIQRSGKFYYFRVDGKGCVRGTFVDIGDGWKAIYIDDSWLVQWPALDGWPEAGLGIHAAYLVQAIEIADMLKKTLNQGEINGREESAQVGQATGSS